MDSTEYAKVLKKKIEIKDDIYGNLIFRETELFPWLPGLSGGK